MNPLHEKNAKFKRGKKSGNNESRHIYFLFIFLICYKKVKRKLFPVEISEFKRGFNIKFGLIFVLFNNLLFRITKKESSLHSSHVQQLNHLQFYFQACPVLLKQFQNFVRESTLT